MQNLFIFQYLIFLAFFDKQLVLLHSFLRSSIGEKQFFDLLTVCEGITKTNLPLDKASSKVLKNDLKKLWDIKCFIFCSRCNKVLKFEGSKCDNEQCQNATPMRNLIVSTCDVRQSLLRILLKYYDFSNISNDNVIDIGLTVNTDGFVPKGHSVRELWPVFFQIADLPQHIKATHGSVALVALVVDNGKPSDFGWQMALTPTVEWLENQEEGLTLNVNSNLTVKVYFHVENLSADLAAACHVFSFSNWASSGESCFKCYVRPRREYGAQRFDLVGPFRLRNNVSTVFDMVRKRHGFKQGSTFWMRLANISHFRFDSLHKICEGVCVMFLKEAFGTEKKKLGNALKIRRKPDIIRTILSIEWPQSCRLYFKDLVSGTATQRLGAFLIALPIALLDSKCTSAMVVFILSLHAIIARVFTKTCKTFDKNNFLRKTAQLQELLCSTKLSTLKFHYFYAHAPDDDEPTHRCSTFVFESLNRRLKTQFATTHAHGFGSVVLERFLLEQLVLLQLERRSDLCEDVSNYLKTTTTQDCSSDRQIGEYFLKNETKSSRGTCYFTRFVKHGRLYSIADDNAVQSRVTVFVNHKICYGEIIKIFYRKEKLQAKVKIFSTISVMDVVDALQQHETQEISDLSADVSRTLRFIIDENVQFGSDENEEVIKIDLDNIIGHCLVVNHRERKFYFNISMKSECK